MLPQEMYFNKESISSGKGSVIQRISNRPSIEQGKPKNHFSLSHDIESSLAVNEVASPHDGDHSSQRDTVKLTEGS